MRKWVDKAAGRLGCRWLDKIAFVACLLSSALCQAQTPGGPSNVPNPLGPGSVQSLGNYTGTNFGPPWRP